MLYSLISLPILILSGSIRYSDRVILYVASGPNAQRKYCCIFSSFTSNLVPFIVSSWISGPISVSYFLFVYCLNRSNHCR